MREDMGLFRGKRLDNGEWIEGYLLAVTLREETAYLIFANSFKIVCGEVKATSYALVDPATIGEYTGLKNENGERIFEDDIVGEVDVCYGHIQVKGVVKDGKFNCGCCHGVYGWYIKGKADIRSFMNNPHLVKKLGNIHDNPELLEV